MAEDGLYFELDVDDTCAVCTQTVRADERARTDCKVKRNAGKLKRAIGMTAWVYHAAHLN